MPQRVSMRLTELRCIAQSEESNGTDPYLWVTYYGHGVPLDGQSGPVVVNTPAYDAFRTEFPNGVQAGQSVPIPAFLAQASFDVDTINEYTHVGVIAVLMEEDSTPHGSIVLGRIAYSGEIAIQLNALVTRRVQTGNSAPITDAEIEAIRKAVAAKAKSAIAGDQFLGGFWRDQDDENGYAYADLGEPELTMLAASPTRSQPITFKGKLANDTGSARYELAGIVTIDELPTEPIDLCKPERTAVEAKKQEIRGLQGRRTVLQQELITAPPGQKAAIVAQITATNEAIDRAEGELVPLVAALELCIDKKTIGGDHGPDVTVVRDQPH